MLPATEFALRLGMPFTAAEAALRPLELDERGKDHGRFIYSTAVDVGTKRLHRGSHLRRRFVGADCIIVMDSGLVDHWFRARADSLPLSTSYERAPV